MRTSAVAAGAAALALAAVIGMALAPGWGRGDAFARCRDGQVAGGDIGGPFALVDGSGAAVTDREAFAVPSILYFGFVSCPDVCPLDMARNAEAARILAERGIEARPVFVSIDPERDTPEIAAAYAQGFHADAMGLSGSPDQVAEAAGAFRVYYAKRGDDPATYLMDHSAYSYLVLPDVGFVDFVDREATPEAVADRLGCFIGAAAS